MSAAMPRITVILAPGGPGLGAETLADLPLPRDCERLSAVPVCNPGDNPIALQAARLIELISAAALRGKVILIGHSAGAWSAIRAASQRSAHLSTVILIAAQLRDRIDQPALLEERLRALDEPSHGYAHRAQSLSEADLSGNDAVLLELLLADMALTLPTTGPAQQSFLDSCRRSWDMLAIREYLARPANDDLITLIKQIRTRVVVINGELDPWSSAASAHEIGTAAEDCKLETIPRAGHAPWLDDPHRVAGLLERIICEARLK